MYSEKPVLESTAVDSSLLSTSSGENTALTTVYSTAVQSSTLGKSLVKKTFSPNQFSLEILKKVYIFYSYYLIFKRRV